MKTDATYKEADAIARCRDLPPMHEPKPRRDPQAIAQKILAKLEGKV